MRKKGGKNMVYTPEFKIKVVEDLRSNHLGYREATKKYAIASDNTVATWERIYIEEGAEGLMRERRGRAPKTGIPNIGRPRLNKEVENDLIAENQHLRMEIEYLKKLSALVLAEEQKNGKKH